MKKHYLALPGVVFIGLIFLLPSGASAADLGQNCTVFLSKGICRPNSGSDMCPPLYSLGSAGNCSTGLICCDPGYLNSSGSGSGTCTSNSTYGVTSCTLSGGGSGVCSLNSFGTPVCAVNPNGVGTGTSGNGGLNTTGVSGNGGLNTTGTNVTLINPLKSGTSLTSFLNNILDFVIQIGSIIVILMLVFVGFKFVVAQGKDAALVEARKMLLWTIIGALVLLGAKAISAGILATVQSL